jgi:hypothetical protein
VDGECQPCLEKLLQGGWVLLDLPGKKGESRLSLATVSRLQKQERERRHPYRQTGDRMAWTICKAGDAFYTHTYRERVTGWLKHSV